MEVVTCEVESDPFSDLGLEFFDIFSIIFWEDESGDAFPLGSHCLFFHSSDSTHPACQRYLSSHRDLPNRWLIDGK